MTIIHGYRGTVQNRKINDVGPAQILEQNYCLKHLDVRSGQGKEGGQAACWAGGAYWCLDPPPHPT